MKIYTEYGFKNLTTMPYKHIACVLILLFCGLMFVNNANTVQSGLDTDKKSLDSQLTDVQHNQKAITSSSQREKAKLLQELKMQNINRALHKNSVNPKVRNSDAIEDDIKAWRESFQKASIK